MRAFAKSLVSLGLVLALSAARPAASSPAPGPTADDLAMPRYQHILVIMDENKDWRRIDGTGDAPVLSRLAREYGDATSFYAEVHPSEGNYVALIGGSTFGIHDDDAYYCRPGMADPSCHYAQRPGYLPHTADGPFLGSQLVQAGLTWKNYEQSLPEPGSLAVVGSNPAEDGAGAPPYFASKHSGFINFAGVQNDPQRAQHLVGFDVLHRDLAAGTLPNFALVIPNLCDDMHGMNDPGIPADCRYEPVAPLIRRGDAAIGRLMDAITASSTWRSAENAAVVITFDEDDGTGRQGCCGITPGASSNFGGGHIATIVVTNHGPRGIADPTPYDHYSLLRTIEDAFGIHEYLRIAGASDQGVRPMLPLFRTSG